MNKQQYNALIKEITSKQNLIARHTKAMKLAETDLANAMRADKIDVFQGDTGTVTYKPATRNKTIINLAKLFKQVKFTLFLQMISFNATMAKPLIKSGKVDSKLIDSVTTIIAQKGTAKLKVTSL